MLINRFTINLRSLDNEEALISTSAAQHFSRFSVPNFRVPESVLGNIGEPLQYGGESIEGDLEQHSEHDDSITNRTTSITAGANSSSAANQNARDRSPVETLSSYVAVSERVH